MTNLRWGIALILGFGVLINYIDRGALSVAAKPLHDELGMGPAEFGFLSSAFFFIYALCQCRSDTCSTASASWSSRGSARFCGASRRR